MSAGAISPAQEHNETEAGSGADGRSSTEHSALDRLATRTGIQAYVEDPDGTRHPTPPDLKRALLRAMRFTVDTEAQAAQAFEALEAAEWDRALPPVTVAHTTNDLISVPVVLPSGTAELRWVVRLEDGTELAHAVQVQELPLLEQREHQARRLERRTLAITATLPWGYHTLSLAGFSGQTALIVTPGTCWLPAGDDSARLWGLAANLFLLRSTRSWGVGDFTDLLELVKLARKLGADVVGLNPLHAMFPDEPEDASPYSPSDRTLLNILYIDVEAIPEFASCDEAHQLVASDAYQQALHSARTASVVQYRTVTELKLQVLRLLFNSFEEQQHPDRLQDFVTFHQERRFQLDRTCTFQALRQYFAQQDPPLHDCAQWPAEYRSSHSPAIASFAREHADLVRFQLWLQWIADAQLKAAAAAAAGMAVGLYRDVAVGAHPGGAEIWSHPDELVSGAQIGAPPDALGPSGQNWGLPPLHPVAAREHAYSSFIALLRANMRYAGGLRIDHAMALQRLYWISKGSDATHGAYVHYAMEDLIGILALESHRHRCLIVGEDLGTVPEGFRDRMAQANILSYRVLFFEREKKTFLEPRQYPYLALGVASNHDLPTLHGWWTGNYIDLKERLGLLPEGSAPMRAEREEDRRSLVETLRREGLLNGSGPVQPGDFSDAAHAFLAKSNALLTLVELDDVTGEEVQVNVPGTSSENPNWRRIPSLSLEQLASDARLHRVATVMAEQRRSVTQAG